MEKRTLSVKTLTIQALSVLSMPQPFLKSDNFAPVREKLDLDIEPKNQIHNDNEENIDEQQDFSFSPIDLYGTLIFADEIFDNGQIRPTYHAFNHSHILTSTHNNDTLPLHPPLKKLFVEQVNNHSSKSKGPYTNTETLQKMTMVEMNASNDKCKKSNSTGFPKIWRFREDLKFRSNSDGKDVFVFLNPLVQMPMKSIKAKEENVILRKGKGGKCKTAPSAHEKLYVMNRKRKESIKRKSFLPYRKELIGIFANVNACSKKLHPY